MCSLMLMYLLNHSLMCSNDVDALSESDTEVLNDVLADSESDTEVT
ncbi:Uncharacterised protein [Staphylococcus gallinarum]|uniref:Uncharacterized protein n=1 Tax=Staphylococcus gallinarum TaxID=1293 RepID=A0A380SB90_STAGA|nr:Uncharacterised protein [Staphylococcus gallinarum]